MELKIKYQVDDILYDKLPTRDLILGTVVAILDDSYMIRVSDAYSRESSQSIGKIVKLSFDYVDNDPSIRLATKAEKILYGG